MSITRTHFWILIQNLILTNSNAKINICQHQSIIWLSQTCFNSSIRYSYTKKYLISCNIIYENCIYLNFELNELGSWITYNSYKPITNMAWVRARLCKLYSLPMVPRVLWYRGIYFVCSYALQRHPPVFLFIYS